MSDINESEDDRSGNISVGTDTSAVTINTTGDHDTSAYILLDESMCRFAYRSSTKSHKARTIVCGRPAGGALGCQCTSHRNKPAEKYRSPGILPGRPRTSNGLYPNPSSRPRVAIDPAANVVHSSTGTPGALRRPEPAAATGVAPVSTARSSAPSSRVTNELILVGHEKADGIYIYN
eukprot:scaffold138585_cov17-Cyclotella_meneghiniana.AAC.2